MQYGSDYDSDIIFLSLLGINNAHMYFLIKSQHTICEVIIQVITFILKLIRKNTS